MLDRTRSRRGLAPFALLALAPGAALAQEAASAALLDAQAFGAGDAFHPRLSLQGTTVVGEDFSLTVRNAGPANLGVLLYSGTQVPTFLPSVMATVFPGAPLFVEGFTVGGALDAEGLLAVDDLPASLAGAEITAQAATFSILAPGFFRVTDALELQFGPAPRSRASVGSLGFNLGISPLSAPLSDVAFGDIDGDGAIDLLAAPDVGSAIPLVSAHFGTGDATFGETSLGGFFTNDQVRLGEFAGDAFLDVFGFGIGGPGIDVFESVNGLFSLALPVDLSSGIGLREASPIDFDSDGDQDIVAFSFSPPELFLHRNDGGGNFASLPPVSVPFLNNNLSDGFGFAIADFDGDGTDDYALANGLGNLVVMQGTASGVGPMLSSLSLSNGGFETGLTAFDANGDGDMDLAVAYGDDAVGPFSFDLLAGDGFGGFSVSIPFGLPRPAQSIRAADVDGDGDSDLLITTAGADLFVDAYFIETLVPSFNPLGYAAPTAIPLGGPAIAAELIDGDGDGDLDLYAASADPAEATIIQWVAGTGFATPIVDDAPGFADSVRLSDVDGDGVLDLLARSTATGEVWFQQGLGDRTFGPETLLFTEQWGGVWDAVDLDGDGDDDIVIIPNVSPSAAKTILYANVDGVFDRKFVFGGSIQGEVVAMSFGDLDEGDPEASLDLAVTSVRQVGDITRLNVYAFTQDETNLDPLSSIFLLPTSATIDLLDDTTEAGIALIDADDDGVDEILVSSPQLPSSDVLLFDRVGSAFTIDQLVLDARAIGGAPRLDLDLDGQVSEVLLVDGSNLTIRHFGVGGAGIQAIADSQFPVFTGEVVRVLVGELGGSSYPDAVSLDSLGRLRFGTGSGGADSLALRDPAQAQLGGNIADFALGDLDGDGVDEIVALHFGVEQRLVISTRGE